MPTGTLRVVGNCRFAQLTGKPPAGASQPSMGLPFKSAQPARQLTITAWPLKQAHSACIDPLGGMAFPTDPPELHVSERCPLTHDASPFGRGPESVVLSSMTPSPSSSMPLQISGADESVTSQPFVMSPSAFAKPATQV